jgi:hypothetical protein
MYKTFKTRAASFSCQHLALAFTMVMSFFFNTLLMAQTEVTLSIDVNQVRDGENNLEYDISCNMFEPQGALPQSYIFKVQYHSSNPDGYGVIINFGNGQDQLVTSESTTINVNYPNYLPAQIRVTDQFSAKSWTGELKRFPHRAMASYTYQTPDETVSVAGINMHIKYAPSNNQRKLKKPLIFVEGIDFGKDVINDMYGKPARVGGFGWDTFITGMVDDPGDSDNETFASLPTFVNQMLSDGYDIVFCDFQDGTAAIPANGQGLIAVINEVNNRKKSGLTAKQTCYTNTVVGASMGGQVVRWALKTMENQGIDHDSNLYLSMDSPHKGANIPLALQAFVWFNANHGPASATKTQMARTWEGITSPAARQLLAFNLGTNGGEHNAYISMMNQLGYPQKTRNVASANGSGNGQNQGYGNNAVLASASGNLSLGIGSVKIFALDMYASGANTIAKLARVFQRHKEIEYLLGVPVGHMSLERQGNNAVILKGGEKNIPVASLLTFSEYSTSRYIDFGRDMTMWDNCPGGNRNDIAVDLVGNATKGLTKELADYNPGITGPSGKQAFIPTVSALDLATNDMHTNALGFIGGNTSSPVNTPFKSVFIANSNEAHVFISQGLLNFARNEIISNTKVSCGGLMTIDPNIEKEMAPGVGGVSPGVNPGVGRTGGMKVIGAEPIGTGLQTREGVAIPVKDDGDNKDN